MSNSTCALCLKNEELKKSHVIPDSIFKKISRNNSGKLITFSSDENSNIHYSSDSWSDYLLCETCEQLLNTKYESYSLAVLRGLKGKVSRHSLGVTFSDIDLVNFNLFVISIFWRAAVSKLDIYNKVYIPEPWQSAIRISLHENLKVPISRVSVKISRLVDNTEGGFSFENIKEFIMSPFFREEKEKFTFCFMFEGFFLEISTPGIKFSERDHKSIVYSHKKGFMAPYLSIFDIPEAVELLVSGYAKHVEGKSKIKTKANE